MNNFITPIVLVLSSISLCCKSNSISKDEYEINSIEKTERKVTDSTYYNNFYILDHDSKSNVFKSKDGYTLKYNPLNNTFDLDFLNQNIKLIDFGKREYDGPGFIAYQYKGDAKIDKTVLVIEAAADIGTAWYYFIILEKNKILDSFLVNEPRSNSEKYSLKDFLSIYSLNKSFIFKFNKKLIAKYSNIPQELKSDNNYIYLLREEKSQKEINSKWLGYYSICVQTEATTTGMASISYYFTITKDKINLETNTYHEPITCNGEYKAIEKNNILELYYVGEEENCQSIEPSFKIKKQGNKYYIKAIGGLGTSYKWIRLDKKK